MRKEDRGSKTGSNSNNQESRIKRWTDRPTDLSNASASIRIAPLPILLPRKSMSRRALRPASTAPDRYKRRERERDKGKKGRREKRKE